MITHVHTQSSDSTDGNSGYASGTVGRSSMSMIKVAAIIIIIIK